MKLAVIGTGKIVKEALYALEPLDEISVTAIYARPHSREKAEALAAKNGISAVYTDYAQLLAQADADTVYIGLVNSAHSPYAKQALEAGKHVILEKPFTVTVAQTEELVQLAHDKGLFLFEAATVLHNALSRQAKAWLPRLGTLRIAQCNYSQYSSRYDNYLQGTVEPAFDPALGGGALGDINFYNLCHCVDFFGAPVASQYFPNRGFNGVDTSGVLLLSYPTPMQVVCVGAKDSESPSFIQVQGEKGWLLLEGKPNLPTRLVGEFVDTTQTGTVPNASGGTSRHMVHEEIPAATLHHRMTQEFADFARVVHENDHATADAWLEVTRGVMKIIGG